MLLSQEHLYTRNGVKNSSDNNKNIAINAESIGMTIANLSNTKTDKNTTKAMMMTMTTTTTNATQEHINTRNGVRNSSDFDKNIVIQMRSP